MLFRKDREASCGGVAVYARNDLVVTRREDLEMFDVEGLWLEIAMPKSRSFLVGTFYKPPHSSKFHDKNFIRKLNSIFDTAVSQEQEVIILGDWNMDFSATRPTADCKQLKHFLKSLQFEQLIKNPTRITKDSETIIDLIATNNSHIISESGVISTGLSDHELVYCVRKLNWRKAPSQIKTFRNYLKYDHIKFCADLKNAEELLSISEGDYTDDNDMWNKFEQGFVSVANNYAPIIQKRVRGINNCPWMNNDIKRDMWQRGYFLKKAHKSNDRESWANYRYHRNRATSKIKKCKESYNRRAIEENSDDSKAFWKTVKKIFPGESKKMSTSLKIGNGVSSDRKTTANAFNDHFVGVMRRLICDTGNSVTNTGRNLMSAAKVRTITQHENRPPFRFKEIKLSSVLGQLCRLKIGKATGLDNIPARLFKDSAAVVAKTLTRIINAS